MNKKLNNLYFSLNKLGTPNAADEVEALMSELASIKTSIISKANLQTSLFGDSSNAPQSSDAAAWQKFIDEYDTPAYRVEAFHTIAEGIASAVVVPIMNKIRATKQDSGVNPTVDDRNQMIATLEATANYNICSTNGLSKIASNLNYSKAFDNAIEDSIDKILNNLPNKYAAPGDIRYIESELSLIKSSSAASGAAHAGGIFSRALPAIGLAISLPLAIKNIVEAWKNGVAIFTELPLSEYGVSKAAIAGGPATILFLVSQLKSAIEENKENPEALYDLLVICKTISAFWLDLIFAATNGVMAIIDGITVLAMIFPLDGPILDAITGVVGAVLTFGLIGLEWGSEWLSHKFWESIKGRIKEIAEQKLQIESTPVESPEQITSPPIAAATPVEQTGIETSLFGPALALV